jgi:hypothetical protein
LHSDLSCATLVAAMDVEGLREIETRLRDAVEQTEALYDGAKEAFDRAKELQEQLGPNHPDGSLRHATRVYTYTQRNFRKALMEFNNFILYQKLPPARKPHGSQSRGEGGLKCG